VIAGGIDTVLFEAIGVDLEGEMETLLSEASGMSLEIVCVSSAREDKRGLALHERAHKRK
jgi:hypothetical protein